MKKFLGLLTTLILLCCGLAPVIHADAERMQGVLDAQSDEMKARYQYRHPRETLAFFGIAPGMTVLEALPGRGWYTKILLPYLGSQGALIEVDYAQEMWPLFGFFGEEFIEGKKTWAGDWTAEVEGWQLEDAAAVSAFVFGSMPENVKGTADAVFLVRALHNLNRFEGQGGFLTTALQDAWDVLKPGGIVGVVQHRAPDDKPDEWADGSRGYLKKAYLIKRLEQAGFEFVAESDVNDNPKDQPGDDDVVWRLPPTLMGSKDNPEKAAQMKAIGESNRMTLKFRKPE
jgi:predicted methyltransferase